MWKWIIGLLAGLFLLGGIGGCASTSGKGAFTADDVTMGTQFQIGWGTVVSIGFPGTVRGKGAADFDHPLQPPAASPVAVVPVSPNPTPPPHPGG